MNRLTAFTKKYGLRFAALVLALVLIYGLSAGRAENRLGLGADAAASLTLPVKQGGAGFFSWLEGIYGYMFRYDRLAEENEALKDRVAELEKKIKTAEETQQENERLRSLLDLRPKHEDFVLELASVIDRPASNWNVTYTLSKGEESDIQVGNCVVDSRYNLVGQIIEVGSGWSTVRSVIDVDMRVGALVSGGGAAMVLGDFGLMQKGEAKLGYLTEEIQVLEGDILITSGKGGAFPKGLEIGAVTSIQTEAGGQVEYATVSPSAELGRLSQVFVVKEFKVID